MHKILIAAALGALTVGASTLALAQSTEDLIKYRQSGYTFMSWNMGKIKAQVVDEKVPYDQAQVAAAANAIAAIANSGMGALYPKGSDIGTGWKETRLKPEFFEEPEKVRDIAVNFVQQANKLQEVAAAGDQAAIKAQFGELGKACKACHDDYREEE